MKLNECLCELVGAFIGDGHFGRYGKRRNQWLVGFVGHIDLDYDYLKNKIYLVIKKHFSDTNPRIYKRPKENTVRVIVYSKEIVEFLLSLGFKFGNKSKTAFLPNKLIHNNIQLKYIIRGLFNTDGSIFFDKRKTYSQPYPRICLNLNNPQLINQTHLLLKERFSINSRMNFDHSRIQINGRKNVLIFQDKIGFSNERHLVKIRKIKPLEGLSDLKDTCLEDI